MAQAKKNIEDCAPCESRDLKDVPAEDPRLRGESKYELLDRVNIPADMRGLSDEELVQLAGELRRETIEVVSRTGGHLGAGLGVVELTVAIHAVFNTPEDRLIWDVGHQCYPHKILTGRRDRMHTLRARGGLSGFTKRSESEYDPFGAAHSSTSISAALGMAVARDLRLKRHPEALALRDLDSSMQAFQNDEKGNNNVVAVIGDGAMSAGMAYEAINNAGALKSRLIVILNDNEMSIAPPVGAMSRYLTKLVTSKSYIGAREAGKKFTDLLPPPLRHAAKRAEEGARLAMSHKPGTYMHGSGSSFFEEMGFYYIGPVDGHNLDHLLPILRNVRDNHQGPVLIHALTEKGKGYLPAENSKDKMHGVKKFDVVTGDQFKSKADAPSYTKVFAQQLIKEAQKDERIVGITAAMPDGTGMDLFGHAFPERMFDVGIAEQHAVTFAGGLAAEGGKPFCAIYSTFLQRAYDQVVHDIAIQNLPVRFAIDRAGLVGADGQTHAGSFDIAYLGCLPNFVLMAAADEAELSRMVATAAAYDDGPIAFRYPRGEATPAALFANLKKPTSPSDLLGEGVGVDIPENAEPLEIGKGRVVYQSPSLRAQRSNPESGLPRRRSTPPRNDDNSNNVAILSYGARLQECLKAAEILEKQGKTVTVADARFAKPLDEDLIRDLAENHGQLITIEEGARGGFGSFVLEFLNNEGLLPQCRVKTLTLPDRFQDQASPDEQYENACLDAKHIAVHITG